tara:strand:- start:219 stop:371 length:153 start_codon:yes stop_codon:yes gene_type:complete
MLLIFMPMLFLIRVDEQRSWYYVIAFVVILLPLFYWAWRSEKLELLDTFD